MSSECERKRKFKKGHRKVLEEKNESTQRAEIPAEVWSQGEGFRKERGGKGRSFFTNPVSHRKTLV